jgi:hypothetical protein
MRHAHGRARAAGSGDDERSVLFRDDDAGQARCVRLSRDRDREGCGRSADGGGFALTTRLPIVGEAR